MKGGEKRVRGERESGQRDGCFKKEGGEMDGSRTKENTSIVISSKGIHLAGKTRSGIFLNKKQNTECIISKKHANINTDGVKNKP